MSGHVGFVEHQFLAAPMETVDPMGESAWSDLRPQAEDARSIRAAIDRVGDEQTKADHRVQRLQDERRTALLRGSASSVESVDARLRRASVWQERVTALAAALPGELAAAEAREAEAARALAERRKAARVTVARFAKWTRDDYPRHALAIAEGLKLEQEAIAAADIADITGEVPRAHTTAADHPRGMPPTTFAHMVRLPNHVAGAPIAWPAGETHPDFAPAVASVYR